MIVPLGIDRSEVAEQPALNGMALAVLDGLVRGQVH
jgi:hypothetical protein